MRDRINTTILSLEMRVGILEDRLCCLAQWSDESKLVSRQLQIVKTQLEAEKQSEYEFMRMMGPG